MLSIWFFVAKDILISKLAEWGTGGQDKKPPITWAGDISSTIRLITSQDEGRKGKYDFPIDSFLRWVGMRIASAE